MVVDPVLRTLTDPVTYRRLVYLLVGAPMGLLWFVILTTVWSLAFGLLVTPIGVPLLFAIALMTRGFATIEAELAGALLGVDAEAPGPAPGAVGFWSRLRARFGAGFWRAQGFLWLRSLIGFPVGITFVSLLAASLGMVFAPLWIPFVHGGAHLGFWRPHTFAESLALVPLGLVLLPLTVAAARPVGAAFGPIASTLLRSDRPATVPALGGTSSTAPARPAIPPRQALTMHAGAAAGLVVVVTIVWALTSAGYFWPVWLALPLGSALAIHAWFVGLDAHPPVLRRFRGSRALAGTTGVSAVVWLFTVAVWAITSQGYFWPIWTLLALGVLLGVETLAVLVGSPDAAEMAERIETLESTRAGAVDVQESELRRIERDLHDGAQARLVALGMSLGMAEQKLAEDPDRAGELLAEARAGAEAALRELRNLARGIHPPVLTDRGLEAALTALANSTPIHVSLSVDIPQRPAPRVETAAYFVAAEALANAGKHARADWVDIRIAQVGTRLELEITDDGVGGADPQGSGLVGLRRRIEALDGRLEVTSPAGGPTTLYAELPCA